MLTFTEKELQLIEDSLRGTLARLGNDKEIEQLIDKITNKTDA